VSCAIKLVQRVANGFGSSGAAGKPAPYMAMLIRWVEAKPDVSVPELAAQFIPHVLSSWGSPQATLPMIRPASTG